MEENNLPPGFRFHPTDEELITYYLTNKVSDFEFTTRAVADVDLNKCEPWDLPGKASMGEKEWYFFSQRDRKYPTGLRTNRATVAGYWKTTGKDKEIFRGSVSSLVGMKKTLVFYRGRAPKGEKTNWVMHEYRLHNNLAFNNPTKEEWVVCRVFQKSSTVRKAQQTPSSPPSQDSPCDTNNVNTMVNEIGDDIQNFINDNMMSINNSSSTSNNFMMNYMNTSSHDSNPMTNWNATASANNSLPSLINWPQLLSTNNLSMNALLLTALQLRSGHQPRGSDHNYSFMAPQAINTSQLGNHDFASINIDMASTSNELDPVSQPPSLSEQPYNVDSNIW